LSCFHILLDWQRSTRALFMFCSLERGREGGREGGMKQEGKQKWAKWEKWRGGGREGGNETEQKRGQKQKCLKGGRGLNTQHLGTV